MKLYFVSTLIIYFQKLSDNFTCKTRLCKINLKF